MLPFHNGSDAVLFFICQGNLTPFRRLTVFNDAFGFLGCQLKPLPASPYRGTPQGIDCTREIFYHKTAKSFYN
jgi:hypothetical protein